MASSSYGLTFLKWFAAIGVPVGVLAYISSAKAGPKGSSGGGGGKGDSGDDSGSDSPTGWIAGLKKKLAADVPASVPSLAPVADGATTVGWYFYANRWIRVDEFVDDAKVTVEPVSAFSPMPDNGKVSDEVSYRGRFRWTVMHNATEASPALAIETTFSTGTATRLGYGDITEMTAETRELAAGNAANKAAHWIDIANGTVES